MKIYKKTIINSINKHFKKIILGLCVLCILFYVIKYYNNKENFNINWNTISYLNQQDPTNLNSEDIDINSGNLNFNLKCDGTNGLKTLCETCHKNYNNTCFRGDTNNICDMVLNSNQCENKCGLESPNNSFDYTRYSGNNDDTNNLNFSSDKTYTNITSLHECEKLCDLNGHESYKYNKKTKQCDTASRRITKSNLEKYTNYKEFNYGTIDKDTFTPDSIFIGTDKIKNFNKNCYSKYNYNKLNECENATKVNKIPIKELNVLDYKECEKLCSKHSNDSENCQGYTFEKNDNLKSDGICKLYKRFFPSNGCKPFETQLDSLYKDTDNEFRFQSGIIKV